MNILSRFIEGFSDFIQKMEPLLKAEDTEPAVRLAHTLKGVAGNIGAAGLQEAAAKAEKTLRDDGGKEAVAAVIAGVWLELEPVLKGISQSKVLDVLDTAAQDKPEGDVDVARLIKLLEQIGEGAARRKPKPCKELMEKIMALPWPEDEETKLKDLDNLIRRYKFRDALPLVQSLINTMGGKPNPS